MALNDIILNAVLETSDINKKLKEFESTGLNLKLLDRATNTELRTAQAQFNQITSSLERAKNTGFFGNKAQIQESVNALKSLNAQNRTNIIGIENQVRAYEKLRQSAINALPQKLQSAYRQAGGGVTGAGAVATVAAGYNPRGATEEAVKRLNMAESEIAALGKLNNAYGVLSNKIKASMDDAKSSLNPLVTALNNLGVTGNSLGGIFGKLIGKVVTWMAATTALFAGLAIIRSFVTELKALEDAQMRLQRVIPTTSDDLATVNKELDTATKRAVAFAGSMNQLAGASFADTINALADIVKVGFSIEDSMMIAKAALLAVNVAEMSVADATRYMTAAIRQFNLNASDSAQIIDKWNALSQKMGASTENIADAATRSGKAMLLVGASFAQVNAMAAATIEATGETGERVGTMLKTVAARYADMGRKNSVSDILGKQGIEVYNKATGTFNNVYDTLGKVAGKWDKLTEAEQANIAKTMAGIHHYSRFVALMTNYDNAVKGVAIALSSQNSALIENARRVNSLDFQIRKLQGSFSKLTQSFVGQSILTIMTASIRTLSLAMSGLGLIITGALVGGIALLTGQLKKLDIVLKLIQANPMIAWLTAVFAVITAGVAIWDSYNNRIAQAMMYTGEYTSALDTNRKQLAANMDSFIETYRRLGSVNDVSKEIAKSVKDIGGEDMFSEFITSVEKGGGATERLITLLRTLASTTNTAKEAMSKFTSTMTGADQGWFEGGVTKGMNFLLGRDYNQELSETALKNISLAAGIDLEKLDQLSNDEFKALKAKLENYKKGIKDIYDLPLFDKYSKLERDEQQALYLSRLIPNIDPRTISGNIKSNLQTYGAGISVIEALMRRKETEGGADDPEGFDEGKKRYESYLDVLLGLYSDYYAELYKKQKDYYDYIKAQNTALVESFTGTLFGDQLKEGGFNLKNIGNAVTTAGGTIIDSSIKQLNDALIDTMTGAAPTDMASRIEFALKTGGDYIKQQILSAFDVISPENLTSGNITSETNKVQNAIDNYARQTGILKMNEPGYLPTNWSVLPPTNIPPVVGDFGIGNRGKVGIAGYGVTQNGGLGLAATISAGLGLGMDKIMALPPDTDKKFSNWWDTIASDKIVSAGMGIMTGMGMNQKMGKEGIMGPLGGLIGSFFGGPGAVIGSMLGSWLDPQAKEQDKVVKDEQVKNARETTRQLKLVNRNLTKMIEQMEPYSMTESYYFSVSRARGIS